jgi:RHS repeat-associated protein
MSRYAEIFRARIRGAARGIYTWGPELSDTLQGAGGLLAIDVGGAVPAANFPRTETAPGNVTTLYDYSPFGLTVSRSGPAADANTYRFSTKCQDGTGLSYYGYRYYDAGLGRWTRRDVFGEGLSWNLFSFLKGRVLDLMDPFGLFDKKV